MKFKKKQQCPIRDQLDEAPQNAFGFLQYYPGSLFVRLFRATRNETELVYVIFLFVKNSFVME